MGLARKIIRFFGWETFKTIYTLWVPTEQVEITETPGAEDCWYILMTYWAFKNNYFSGY